MQQTSEGNPIRSDLAIIGGLPPPYGGVSIHLKRLLPHLDQAGIRYHVYDTSGESVPGEKATRVGRNGGLWFAKYLLCGREPVVYLHTSQWGIWAATWWLSRVRGKSVIITVHTDSLRRLWGSRGRLARWSVVRAFRAAKAIVAVNTHIRDFLNEVAGVGTRTVVVPAFVPPLVDAEDEKAIAPTVRDFCRTHHPLILANGAPIVYQDGRDLYGIDMTIELADRLRERWPKIGVVWYVLKFPGWSPSYLERMSAEVGRRGLGAHWLFAEPTGEMYPVFRDSQVFVRPTCSDGDAVSIREALHFGVPTVASDAAPRPEGTIVFRSRDTGDFKTKVEGVLDRMGVERERRVGPSMSDAVADEIALLKRAISESAG